jgi:uncharacterized protein YndB with AHSA1/START domain
MPLNSRIEKRVWIKASAEIVYRALTNAKDLTKWFCDRADIAPYLDGEFRAFWKSGKAGQEGRAVITGIEPNSSLEMVWIDDGHETPAEGSRHTLNYTIKSKSGMTEVLMVDEDIIELDEETYTFLDHGWNSVLLELKDFCERKERLIKMKSETKSGLEDILPQ